VLVANGIGDGGLGASPGGGRITPRAKIQLALDVVRTAGRLREGLDLVGRQAALEQLGDRRARDMTQARQSGFRFVVEAYGSSCHRKSAQVEQIHSVLQAPQRGQPSYMARRLSDSRNRISDQTALAQAGQLGWPERILVGT
jgi:hypothetical protein